MVSVLRQWAVELRAVYAADEADEEADDENMPQYNKLLMPELIVSLDASDDFLRQRVMNLPESVVVGTHNTEDGLMRRLAEYRAVNTDDDTVLNYFDELELHPEHIGQSTIVFRLVTLVSFIAQSAVFFADWVWVLTL